MRANLSHPTKQAVREAVWLGGDVRLIAGTPWYAFAQHERLNLLLLAAIALSRVDEVDLLLQRGADPNNDASFDDYMTPLITAARCASPHILELLMRAGANVNLGVSYSSDESHIVQDSTALIWAAERGDPEIVSILLRGGANPNAQETFFGEHGLGEAPILASRSSTVTNLLLKAGANPNAHDRLGRTPLMIAAEEGDLQACRLLLQFGAVRGARDVKGMTAEDYATWGGDPAIVSLLKG